MNAPHQHELHALFDGQLPPKRAAEVEQWLQQHPAQAAQLAQWQAQKRALQAAFDPVLDAPLPLALRQPPSRRAWRQRAAAVMWLTIGLSGGYLLGHQPPAAANLVASLPQQAAIAHVVYTPEVRHPVEVGADQQGHLLQWLSKRLNHPLRAPDLASRGYQLIGGRLLPGDSGAVAHLMYQNSQGQRLTLYVKQNTGQHDTAFRFTRQDKVSVFWWLDGELGYALSAELPRNELLALAELSYRQLGGS